MRGLIILTAILAANPEPVRLDREYRVERGYGRAGGPACYANLCTQPNAFNAWTALGGGGPTAPTVTANQAQAPDGSGLTADRVQVSSCAAGFSVVFLNQTVTAATQYTTSVYVYGNGSSGSIGIYNYDSTAATGDLVAWPYLNGLWTRIYITRTNANTTLRLGIGCMNDPGVTGHTNSGAADVFLWGAGLQAASGPACFADLLDTPTGHYLQLVRLPA